MNKQPINWQPEFKYKQMVSECLASMSSSGMTHAEIGRAIGVKGNVVSMHMYPDNPISPFPTDRLPALADAVHLEPIQCLKIARQRSIDHPDNATAMDTRTFDWILKNTVKSIKKGGKDVH